MSTPSSRGFFLDIKHHGYSEAFARRFGRVDIGGSAYSLSELSRLDHSTCSDLVRTCARTSNGRGACWIFDAVHRQTGDINRAWRVIWDGLRDNDDDLRVGPILVHCLRSIENPTEIMPAAAADVRCLYLLGYICKEEAEEHNRTDREWFDCYRQAALDFLEAARNLPTPPDSATDYSGAVGPALEAAMYLQFVSPSRSSSSYSSVGGG